MVFGDNDDDIGDDDEPIKVITLGGNGEFYAVVCSDIYDAIHLQGVNSIARALEAARRHLNGHSVYGQGTDRFGNDVIVRVVEYGNDTQLHDYVTREIYHVTPIHSADQEVDDPPYGDSPDWDYR